MARPPRKVVIPVVLALVAAALLVYWGVGKLRARHRPLVAAGTLEAVEVDVSPILPGRLTAVLFDEGDAVAKGAEVAALDAAEIDAAAAGAAAGAAASNERITSARAALTSAEGDFAKLAAAFDGGAITRAEYDRARARRDAARADLANAVALAAQADANRAQLEARRREVKLYAPEAGVVLSRNLEPGEVVNAGTPVLTIADLSTLELHVFIPETRLGLVRVGDPVKVEVDSYPHEEFAGRVKVIGSRAAFTPRNVESKEDRVTLVFEVTVRVPNGDGRLKPGMPADVIFIKAVGGR